MPRASTLRRAVVTIAAALAATLAPPVQAGSELAATLRPALADALGQRGIELIDFKIRGPLALPAGCQGSGAVVLPAGALNLGALAVGWNVSCAGGPPLGRQLDVRASGRLRVLVARQALAPGDVLAGRVASEARRVDGPLSGLLQLARVPDLPMLTARRAIEAGGVLRSADVREQPAVRAGSTVRLSGRSGVLRVVSAASALRAGRIGERIPVRVFESGRTLSARVVARGQVEFEEPVQ